MKLYLFQNNIYFYFILNLKKYQYINNKLNKKITFLEWIIS